MPKRILVVEDNIDLRDLLEMYLRDAGHTVAVAEGGTEAYQAGLAQKVDEK